MIKTISKNKKILVAILFLAVLILPLTISRLNQREEVETKANATSTLSIAPNSSVANPIRVEVGQTTTVDIMLDPGTNLVSFVKFDLLYDSTKLSVSSTGLVINTQELPLTVEGPLIAPGRVAVSLGIGSDPTNAITVPTKVASITFTATQNSGAPVELKFGPITQALSIGATDQATDNVLATINPGYILVGPATITPSPTIPITVGPSNPNVSPTTPQPTSSITNAPTSVQATPIPNHFRLVLELGFHGIGSAGDNPNPRDSSLSNKNPIAQERMLNVEVVNSDNQIVATKLVTAFYNSDSGAFFSNVDIPMGLPANEYVVKVKTDRYLKKLMPGFFTIEPGKTTKLPRTDLIAGDVNDDNLLNILDYNVLYDCGYGELRVLPMIHPQSAFHDTVCQAHTKNANADINDDGRISPTDYNLYLRELSVQVGE